MYVKKNRVLFATTYASNVIQLSSIQARGSVQGAVEGGVRCGEEVFNAGREELVPRGRNLPDRHAQAREHTGVHRVR